MIVKKEVVIKKMLLQFEYSGINWIIGVGLMFGLAYLMYYLLGHDNLREYMIWVTVFNAFTVLGGLLPLWTLILCLVLISVIFYLDFKKGNSKVA